MRHTTAVLLAAALLLATGCGSSSDDKPATKPKATPTVSTANRYLDAVRAADLPYSGERPADGDLVAFPPKWCKELGAGHSVAYLFDETGGAGLYPYGYDWGMEKADADRLLVIGVKAYCPQQLDAVTSELRASGEY